MRRHKLFPLAVLLAGAVVLAGCGEREEPAASTTMGPASPSAILSTIPAGTTSSTVGAPATLSISPPTTMGPTTVPPPTSSVVPAPPGRLWPVDATGQIQALFPTPFTASLAMELAVEVTTRLRASFDAAGFFADVGGVSLVHAPAAGGEAASFVIEVRNLEESGDDSTPGYDLVVVMRPDQSGNWAVTSATRQTICKRGAALNTDPPLCI